MREFEFRRKTPVHETFRESVGHQSRPRVWKRVRLGVSLVVEDDDDGGRQLHDILFLGILFMTGRALAKAFGVARKHAFRFARVLSAASFACVDVQWIYTRRNASGTTTKTMITTKTQTTTITITH